MTRSRTIAFIDDVAEIPLTAVTALDEAAL
jgi:hypothetical protein